MGGECVHVFIPSASIMPGHYMLDASSTEGHISHQLVLPCSDSLWVQGTTLFLLIPLGLKVIPVPAVAGPGDASLFLMGFFYLVYIFINSPFIKLSSITPFELYHLFLDTTG